MTQAIVSSHHKDIPLTYREAASGDKRDVWMAAMQDEIKSFADNKAWKLVKLPEGRKAVKTKWVYDLKTNASEELIRYESRLVAKGLLKLKKSTTLTCFLQLHATALSAF